MAKTTRIIYTSCYRLIILGCIVLGCASQRVSVIEGCNYDRSNNQTSYFVLPYGSASLPGEWKKVHYNSVSFQQFLVNNDSIRITIAFNRFDRYEFNSNGKEKGMNFVEGFYEWDSKYFIDSYGLKRELIEKDNADKYIVYRIYGETNQINLDTYFLIGEKNGNTTSLSISITDKWSREDKIAFLKKVFVSD